jgi:hypothetical protein
MPDLKSELSKVINAWEPTPAPTKEEPKKYFTTTNNVCRATFDHIRDNPGKTRKEVCNALAERGYKESSTTTLIGQMIKQSHVRESNGLLYAIKPEYEALKGSKAWAKIEAAKAAPRKHVELVSKSTGKVFNPRPAQEAPQINSTWDADVMLNSLSIVQARALYDSLRKIFGG